MLWNLAPRWEIHPLGQRQLIPVVDRRGQAAGVCLPRVAAALAASAGLFLAAESPADLGPRSAGVDVRHAAVRPERRREQFSFTQVGGEDSRGQPLRYRVV